MTDEQSVQPLERLMPSTNCHRQRRTPPARWPPRPRRCACRHLQESLAVDIVTREPLDHSYTLENVGAYNGAGPWLTKKLLAAAGRQFPMAGGSEARRPWGVGQPTPSRSTTNTSVSSGPITRPAPRLP